MIEILPTVTGEFRVAVDPELRFTPSGMAICKMRCVASSRKKNEQDEWVDDKACWVSVIGFKTLAENMAESFQKGDLVTLTGKIQTEDWEDKDGGKRTSVEIVVYHLGHSVTFDAARTLKGERQPAGQRSADSGGASRGAPADDPWSTSPSGGGSQPDEPPW